MPDDAVIPKVGYHTSLERNGRKRYSNLPGIRGLHDFMALRNKEEDAVMKVRYSCYTGTLKATPMKITRGMNPNDRALPGVDRSQGRI